MGRGHAALVLLALLAPGCSPAAQNAHGRTALESRAAFDLECPRSSLVVAALSRNSHGTITSYGVEGCGRRATYVRLHDSTWLMNPSAGAPMPGATRPVRVPVERRPKPVPLPPRPTPSAAPAPSGSAERGQPPGPPSSVHPREGEPEPRLPALPGQEDRPAPLGPSR